METFINILTIAKLIIMNCKKQKKNKGKGEKRWQRVTN